MTDPGRVTKKTLRDVDVADRRCVVRVDFNVPTRPENGEIADDSRIRAALPTIHHLLVNNCRIVVMTHFGRPKGKVVEDMRLDRVRQRLSDWLNQDVSNLGGPSGPEVAKAAALLANGEVGMLENLRFDPGEEANEAEFAASLAKLGDIYINDAFGAAHRAHASVVGITEHLPSVAGYLMAQEIEMLTEALESDASPSVAVVGGAKVADKIKVLESLSGRYDALLIGGGMAAAFLKAQGKTPGKAVVTEEEVHAAGQLLFSSDAEVLVPVDVVTAEEFSADAEPQVRDADEIRPDELILDIGPATIERYGARIRSAFRIVWNGPMGVCEWPQFAEGSHAVARAIAAAPNAFKVIGGGSTAAVVEELGLSDHITHVSTGGGASLEFLEGQVLPGVAALDDLDK